jgi:hypothetical protein
LPLQAKKHKGSARFAVICGCAQRQRFFYGLPVAAALRAFLQGTFAAHIDGVAGKA